MQAKQSKEFIHSFPWQAGVQPSPGKQGSITRNGYLGRENAITPNVPPFLLLPPAVCAEHDAAWCGISLWSAGVSCPSRVPSQLLVHPQPTRWWGGVRRDKALTLCQHCSAGTKTSLGSQHSFQHKSKTQPHTSDYEEN